MFRFLSTGNMPTHTFTKALCNQQPSVPNLELREKLSTLVETGCAISPEDCRAEALREIKEQLNFVDLWQKPGSGQFSGNFVSGAVTEPQGGPG
jgi:hypothetical protein